MPTRFEGTRSAGALRPLIFWIETHRICALGTRVWHGLWLQQMKHFFPGIDIELKHARLRRAHQQRNKGLTKMTPTELKPKNIVGPYSVWPRQTQQGQRRARR